MPLEAKDELARSLGAQFRAVRQRKRWTLRRLAEALGCSVNTVRWHEAGASVFRVDMLVRSARIMNTTPANLLKVPDDIQ